MPPVFAAESVRKDSLASGRIRCATVRFGGQKLWMISRDCGTPLERMARATIVANASVGSKSGSVGTFLISMLACAPSCLMKSRTCASVGMEADLELSGLMCLELPSLPRMSTRQWRSWVSVFEATSPVQSVVRFSAASCMITGTWSLVSLTSISRTKPSAAECRNAGIVFSGYVGSPLTTAPPRCACM